MSRGIEPAVRNPLNHSLSHPLGGELAQAAGRGADRLPGARIDLEVEPGREAQRPENPEVVLPETRLRLAHRADQLRFDVHRSVERVAPFVPQRMMGDRVDGEVAAGEVVLEGHAVLHHGVAAVGAHILAEGRDLVVSPPGAHRDGAEALPDRQRVC